MKLIMLNVLKTNVTFGRNLKIIPELLKSLLQLYGRSLITHCKTKPPVFIRSEEGYELVAMHYAYDYLLHHASEEEPEIPAWLASEDEITSILKIEEIETKMVFASEKALKTNLTPAGLARHKHRESGMVCPLCGNVLQGPKGRKAIQVGENKGYFKVTCLGKYDIQKKCLFKAYLSSEEIKLFWQRKYPTAIWLRETDEKCEKCGKPTYLRTRGNIKKIMCKDNYLEDGTCTYRRDS